MPDAIFSSVSDFINSLLNSPLCYRGAAGDPPLVSIVSSYYNAHRYFEETYRTVVGQTMQDFEWLIVDDGSTDEESVGLFEGLEGRAGGRIRTLRHTQNRGLAAGRNTAISQARGKYLFFLDLDDLIDPTYLEKCVLFLELHPDFSFVNSYMVEFMGKEFWNSSVGGERIRRQAERNCWTVMTMYRREDFERLGGFDEEFRYFEDWERWTRAFAGGQKAWTIPEFLQCYRRRPGGLLSSAIAEEGEEKRVEGLIKSRYQEQLELNPPEVPPRLPRPSSYEPGNLGNRLEIENILTPDGEGQPQQQQQQQQRRILFLFPHLSVGGADKFNLDLLTLFKEKSCRLTIATTQKAEHLWHENFYKITPDIFHLPHYSAETGWLRIVSYLIKSRQIDVVFISNSYFAYYLLPLLRREFPGVAFVDYVHMHDLGWKFDGYPRVSRQFSDCLDLQIVGSRYLAKYNAEFKPSLGDKLKVCYTGVDTEAWQPDARLREQTRGELGIGGDDVLILFPARLAREKRPLFLVEIIRELVKERQAARVKMLVIGDGVLLEPMLELIRKYALEDVFQHLSWVDPKQIKQYYAAADIFLLPSEYEGVAVSVYEAMAMGLPVVAADVGGQGELVTGETGYLIPRGETETAAERRNYADVLESLVEDASLRRRTGARAREFISQRFSLKAMIACIEEAITQAAKKRRAEAAAGGSNPPPEDATKAEQINTALAEEVLTLAMECYRYEEAYSEDFQWMTEQQKNWQETAEAQKEEIARLTEGKNWVETQFANWKQIAGEKDEQLEQLRDYIAELLSGKEWLETQFNNWKRLAEEREAELKRRNEN